jgi:transposase
VLADLREKLKPFYRETGRPSIDPELMLKMLIVGYCHGIRFERKLCEEVELPSPIVGSVASLSTTRSPITRHSRSIATAASVTATSSDNF